MNGSDIGQVKLTAPSGEQASAHGSIEALSWGRSTDTLAPLQHADQAREAVLAVTGGDALAKDLQDGGRK